MPEMSLENIIEAVRTGQTIITRRLNHLLDVVRFSGHPHFEAFRAEGHLDKLDTECIEALNLPQAIVDHLDHWPAAEKEKARRAMVMAVDAGVPLIFRWKVTRSSEPVTEISGDLSVVAVTFFSPALGAEVGEEDKEAALA